MTRIITPPAMLSYPRLDKPQADTKGVEKYSCALVFAPGTDLSELENAALAVAKERWPGKPVAQLFAERNLRWPIRKVTSVEVAKGYPEGGSFINVRTTERPTVVLRTPGPDGKPQVVPEADVRKTLYPGCFVRASLGAFAYDTDGNKGASFGLSHIQKWADGKRVDGRADAQDEFEADLKEAPASLADLAS